MIRRLRFIVYATDFCQLQQTSGSLFAPLYLDTVLLLDTDISLGTELELCFRLPYACSGLYR